MTACATRQDSASAEAPEDVPPGMVRLPSGQLVPAELAAQVLPPPGSGTAARRRAPEAQPAAAEASWPSPCCARDEVEALRAELAQEREARVRAEAHSAGLVEGYRRAMAQVLDALAGRVALAPSPVTLDLRDGQRDSVTGSVTVTLEEGGRGEEKKAQHQRELARVRQQNRRTRQRSVTASVTASPEASLPPPPPPSAQERRGALVAVTVAARDGQRDTLREHRTPVTLPPTVQALRESWNGLVAPHGFPAWGERTSRQLLADALAALKRRPLEEWKRVFALVPRSPVCRGELRSRQRASYVYVLTGRTREGYEVAEQLLSGAWSVDPEPPPPEEPGAVMCQEGAPPSSEAAEAVRAWVQVLAALRAQGKEYCAQQLQRARPVAMEEGHLVVALPDRFALSWVEDNFAELLRQQAARLGHAGVRLALEEGGTS